MVSIRICCSRSLLANDASRLDAQSGGNNGHTGLFPPHMDCIASCDIDFHKASSFKLNRQTSTESLGCKISETEFNSSFKLFQFKAILIEQTYCCSTINK